jgi:hypothetical protein
VERTGVSAAGYSLLHIRVRAFAAFGDEAIDPRRDNGQRYRAELEHGIVERAYVEFCSERFLRLAPTKRCNNYQLSIISRL